MLTPSELSKQLTELTQENYKGVTAVFEAENNLAEAEYNLDTVEQTAFLGAEGSVAERNAVAKLSSAEMRFERDLAKAKFNRVRLKIKAVESAMMATATQAKLFAVEWRQ